MIRDSAITFIVPTSASRDNELKNSIRQDATCLESVGRTIENQEIVDPDCSFLIMPLVKVGDAVVGRSMPQIEPSKRDEQLDENPYAPPGAGNRTTGR